MSLFVSVGYIIATWVASLLDLLGNEAAWLHGAIVIVTVSYRENFGGMMLLLRACKFPFKLSSEHASIGGCVLTRFGMKWIIGSGL
jgi:hypothetical protein